MPDKVTFEYAIIRLVPKVEREEFMNIGVILFSKRKDFLKMKFLIDEKRILSFCQEINLDEIKRHLQAWEDVCQGEMKGGEIGKMDTPLRFRWLVATRSTIIQSSQTHSGLCDNPNSVLENLYERYVVPC